jgi:hypothetical protein
MSSGKTTQKLMCCVPTLEARHVVKNLELYDVSA